MRWRHSIYICVCVAILVLCCRLFIIPVYYRRLYADYLHVLLYTMVCYHNVNDKVSLLSCPLWLNMTTGYAVMTVSSIIVAKGRVVVIKRNRLIISCHVFF